MTKYEEFETWAMQKGWFKVKESPQAMHWWVAPTGRVVRLYVTKDGHIARIIPIEEE